MTELKIGMKLKVLEEWNNAASGKHMVEDIVTILEMSDTTVTFHSEYLHPNKNNKPFCIPIKNFWNGVKLIEIL